MPKTYRAVLIDPAARIICDMESDCALDSIHEHVKAGTLDSFGMALYDDGGRDIGWIDDGGLSRNKPIHGFLLPINKDPFAGCCFIIGADRRGETCGARMPLGVLERDIRWLGLIVPEVTWDRTDTGSRAIVTYQRVQPKGTAP